MAWLGLVAGCGGDAVIDAPPGTSGGGGTTSVSSNSGSTATTSTGAGVPACQELDERYRNLVQQAQTCNSDIDVPQCQNQVIDDLHCPCEVWVGLSNADPRQMADVAGNFVATGCGKEGVPCREVECPSSTGPGCVDDAYVNRSN